MFEWHHRLAWDSCSRFLPLGSYDSTQHLLLGGELGTLSRFPLGKSLTEVFLRKSFLSYKFSRLALINSVISQCTARWPAFSSKCSWRAVIAFLLWGKVICTFSDSATWGSRGGRAGLEASVQLLSWKLSPLETVFNVSQGLRYPDGKVGASASLCGLNYTALSYSPAVLTASLPSEAGSPNLTSQISTALSQKRK